ncbi:MAG: hypothetical protein EPN93_06810 [Spirochaetes bacterium]|nr:MAG: hypothetical protein EPN93_06810 [Spirochaetota bacterium]
MEETHYVYRCRNCDKTVEAVEGSEAPTCCEKQMVMEPLEQCTSAEHPEMARNADDNEPCDDNRGKEN